MVFWVGEGLGHEKEKKMIEFICSPALNDSNGCSIASAVFHHSQALIFEKERMIIPIAR